MGKNCARGTIVQQPTAEFEINISDRSFVTNATYQTDAQSKFSVKIQPGGLYFNGKF